MTGMAVWVLITEMGDTQSTVFMPERNGWRTAGIRGVEDWLATTG